MSQDETGEQESAPGVASTLADVHAEERQQLWRRSMLRSIGAGLLMVVAYALFPLSQLLVGIRNDPTIFRSTSAIALVLFVIVLQVRAVTTSPYPQLRLLEGASLVVPMMLVVFSSIYLSLSVDDTASFTEPLNKVGALYFALTTSTTVGFGDISAVSDWARTVVMMQMVVSFAGLGVAGKVAIAAIQRRQSVRSGN